MKSVLVGIAVLAFANAASGATPTVTVGGVTIEGVVSSINSKTDEYFGIPYATASRWSPPHAHAALSNPFDASHLSTVKACPQLESVVVGATTLGQSEDCLSLNVFVPASATPTSKLPVFVWIHGGEFENGAGIEYLPVNMVAAHNIIAVSINYRLGALGWLAQKAFEAGARNAFQSKGDAGNYGLMDQQFAIEWVKQNIAAFGGDPAKVTIGGESAGGFSVLLQMASTKTASGLFRGAIVESGAYALHSLPTKSAYESQYGNPFVNMVLATTSSVGGTDCSKLTAASKASDVHKCLDSANLSSILAAQQAVFQVFGYSPNSGTLVVPSDLETALSSGAFFKIPVLAGTNMNEGRFFEPGLVAFSPSNFHAVVSAGGPANYDIANANSFCGGSKCTYAKEINLVLAEDALPRSINTAAFASNLAKKNYPQKSFPDPYLPSGAPSADEGISQILTDLLFSCNEIDAEKSLTRSVIVYAYELNDPLAPPTLTSPARTMNPNDQYGFPTGAEHGAELQFLFFFPFTSQLSSDEQKLETAMQSYWADFVTSGNPNTGSHGAPKWPMFGSKNNVMALIPGANASVPITTFAKEHVCSVWEPIISR